VRLIIFIGIYMSNFLKDHFAVHMGTQFVERDDKHMKKLPSMEHLSMIVKAVPADGGGVKKKKGALAATTELTANEAEHDSEPKFSNTFLPAWKPTKDQCLRILRMKDVLLKTGLSRSTIYNYIAAGNFPKQIKLGERAMGFYEHDVDTWLIKLQDGE